MTAQDRIAANLAQIGKIAATPAIRAIASQVRQAAPLVRQAAAFCRRLEAAMVWADEHGPRGWDDLGLQELVRLHEDFDRRARTVRRQWLALPRRPTRPRQQARRRRPTVRAARPPGRKRKRRRRGSSDADADAYRSVDTALIDAARARSGGVSYARWRREGGMAALT
jgi:hypothetical protein